MEETIMSWAKKAATPSTVVENLFDETFTPVDTMIPLVDSPPRVWSAQQEEIFSYVDKSGHLVIVARAGTGKTTTIVEFVRRFVLTHDDVPVIVCAFNKRIAEELTERLLEFSTVEVKTLHAIGYSIIRNWWGKIKVAKPTFKRGDLLTDRVCGKQVPDSIRRLVTKLHTKGREVIPKAQIGAELYGLAERFECAPDHYWELQGFGVDYICTKATEAMKLSEDHDTAKETGIDYADMVGLPVRMGWTYPQYGLVVVDEAQDMSPAKHDLAIGVCSGRMVVVGDDRQAIYGFSGADSGALATLKKRLQAKELGLTTTYRCGKAIVKVAQEYVSDIQAGEANGEGVVREILTAEVQGEVKAGDFVLSRLNAPLVSLAMRLLRQGTRTKIAGRDIGEGLKKLVEGFARGSNSVPEFCERLSGWREKQLTRAEKLRWKDRIEQIEDQFFMLSDLASNARSVGEITARIDHLFTDELEDKDMVTCSTVHKAKGLERDRVFLLWNTFRPGKSLEEDNIIYVSITRAKKELVWVR